jgi:cytochrome c oxidase subunit 4
MAQAHPHNPAHNPGHQDTALEDTHATHHIVSPVVYLVVVGILFVLTFLTIKLAYINFHGLWNLVIALGIATVKATLVILFFMHVKWSGRLIHITIGVSLMFFVLLISGTLMDQYTRSNVILVDEPTKQTQLH